MAMEDSKIVDGAEDVEVRLAAAEKKIEKLEKIAEDYATSERIRLGIA